MADEKDSSDQEEKIRELEEKIRRLEEKGEAPPGTAASVLSELGGMIPGLQGLLKGLAGSEAFQERLKLIDQEIEARFRSGPLKRGEEEGSWPSFQTPSSGRTVTRRPPPGRRQPARPGKRQASTGEPTTQQEPPVDVFDEETHLKVIVELPGVEEKDIKVELTGDRLDISADAPTRKYRKEITLPYAPSGPVEKLYRNGVLELTFQKE